MFSVYQCLESQRNSSIFLSSSWTIKTKYPSHFYSPFYHRRFHSEPEKKSENKPEQTILLLQQLAPFIKSRTNQVQESIYILNKNKVTHWKQSVCRVWTSFWKLFKNIDFNRPKSLQRNYSEQVVRMFCPNKNSKGF